MSIRDQRLSLYHHRYDKAGEKGDLCLYCGERATGFDHVPPLSVVDNLVRCGLQVLNLRLYPCCSECNSILGDIYLATLKERRDHLLKYYLKKYHKTLSIPLWYDQELATIGSTLQKWIESKEAKSRRAMRKIEHLNSHGSLDGVCLVTKKIEKRRAKTSREDTEREDVERKEQLLHAQCPVCAEFFAHRKAA